MLAHLQEDSQKELAKRLADKAQRASTNHVETNVAVCCIDVEYVGGLTCILAVNVFLRQRCSVHWLGPFLLLQAKQKQFITELIVQGLLMLLEVPVTMILLPRISQSANLRDL